MNVFVTGISGFIGRHLASRLIADGHVVTGLVRDPELVIPGVTLVYGGLLGEFEDSLKECDCFIHLAAAGVKPNELDDWVNCFEVNVNQTMSILQQAINAGVSKFLLCGSCFEYGESAEEYEYIPSDAPLKPTGAYHSSKAAATMLYYGLCKQYDLKATLFRPFHTYGEGESPNRFWPSIVRAAREGKDFSMTNGEQIRDFSHVSEVVAQISELLGLLKGNPSGELQIKNIGNGTPVSLREFATEQWEKYEGKGKLLWGKLPYRDNEVMRFVPEL